MDTRKVGFDRELKLAWLDSTADIVSEGLTPQVVQARLDKILEGELSDNNVRGVRGKTITVLLRIWSKVPEAVIPLRADAIKLLHVQNSNRLALHWGLCLASYPFFFYTAETIGRLAKLQGSFSANQVQIRVREQYGERETVSRAVNRIIQSLADWKIIRETDIKRSYQLETPLPIKNKLLAAWLVEAILISKQVNYASIKTVIQNPVLFPFSIDSIKPSELKVNQRLEVFRQGLDEDMVRLRY